MNVCVLGYLIDGQVADKSQGSLRIARSPFSLCTSYIYGFPPSLFPHWCSKLHVCVSVVFYSVEIYVAMHRASFPVSFLWISFLRSHYPAIFLALGSFLCVFLVCSYCADGSNSLVCCRLLWCVAAYCRVLQGV